MAHFEFYGSIGYLNGLVVIPLSLKLSQRQCCLAGVADLSAVPARMLVFHKMLARKHANVRLVQLNCLSFLGYALFDHFQI